MSDVRFDENLVVFVEGAGTYQEVESYMSQVLLEQGYVRESFSQAIADREVAYPTGLEFGEHSIAMPHCDIEHVVSPAICMGVLEKPVDWRRMDDPEATCKVELVVMLALNEAHAHLEMLQKVVALLQDQDLVSRIIESGDPAGAYALAKDCLL